MGLKMSQTHVVESAHPTGSTLHLYLRFTQIEPYAGVFERRRPAFHRGGWGSEPPDPGSASARKIATHKYLTFAARLVTDSY